MREKCGHRRVGVEQERKFVGYGGIIEFEEQMKIEIQRISFLCMIQFLG